MTTIREESLRCPRCGCVFLATGLASYGFAGKDTDGRPFFWGLNPLPFFVKTCPECDFSAFSADFMLETKLSSRQEASLPAPQRYLKAASCYDELGNIIQAARCYHHAGWLFEDEKEEGKAHKCYKDASSRYLEIAEKEENLEYLFLGGECARKAGDMEAARAIFDDILQRPLLPPELKELVFKSRANL